LVVIFLILTVLSPVVDVGVVVVFVLTAAVAVVGATAASPAAVSLLQSSTLILENCISLLLSQRHVKNVKCSFIRSCTVERPVWPHKDY
jgi:hypothetical protein